MAISPNGAVQDCTWVLCFLTQAAMQYCDQNGAVQRDVTDVLRWVLTAIILYIYSCKTDSLQISMQVPDSKVWVQ